MTYFGVLSNCKQCFSIVRHQVPCDITMRIILLLSLLFIENAAQDLDEGRIIIHFCLHTFILLVVK